MSWKESKGGGGGEAEGADSQLSREPNSGLDSRIIRWKTDAYPIEPPCCPSEIERNVK